MNRASLQWRSNNNGREENPEKALKIQALSEEEKLKFRAGVIKAAWERRIDTRREALDLERLFFYQSMLNETIFKLSEAPEKAEEK